MATSAFVAVVTRFVAVALLFPEMLSVDVVVIMAVELSVVPDAVAALTWTTGENVALAFAASEAMVQMMFPLEPTGGVVPQLQPAGGLIDWKPVPGGTGMVTLTFAAAAGPLFVATAV
jgi:hypothetical protein